MATEQELHQGLFDAVVDMDDEHDGRQHCRQENDEHGKVWYLVSYKFTNCFQTLQARLPLIRSQAIQ